MKRFSLCAVLGLLACSDDASGPGGDPTSTASIAIPPNYGIHDTFVRDGLAFVSAWNSGLLIYDVGNGIKGGSPSDPRLVSTIVTADRGVAGGAQVHNAWWFHDSTGARRYVFVGQEGPGVIGQAAAGDIHVVDVTNLEQPTEVAFYHLPGAGTHNFWVDEAAAVLYAAYYNGGVVALDISGTLSGDLASREIARVLPGGTSYVWGVQLEGGSLYATDMLSGLWQLRLAGGQFQVAGGGANVPARFTSDLWVRGGYAYTGTWGQRAAIGNVVNVWQLDAQGAPVLVDSIITGNITTVSDVEVSPDGTLLLFSSENGPRSGLQFYRLTDPAHPRFIRDHLVPGGVHTATFAAIGGRLYVFAAKNPPQPALVIIDVTDL